MKKGSRSTLELFYAENSSRKQLLFEKSEDFENWLKWPVSKGYSLCKMVSLGQKLKLPKIYKKTTVRAHWNCFMQKTARKNS